VLSGQLAC